MLYWVHLLMNWMGFKLTTLVVIGTDWTGSCKTTIRSRPRQPPKGICQLIIVRQCKQKLQNKISFYCLLKSISDFLLKCKNVTAVCKSTDLLHDDYYVTVLEISSHQSSIGKGVTKELLVQLNSINKILWFSPIGTIQ
jgi:hypothetical protein